MPEANGKQNIATMIFAMMLILTMAMMSIVQARASYAISSSEAYDVLEEKRDEEASRKSEYDSLIAELDDITSKLDSASDRISTLSTALGNSQQSTREMLVSSYKSTLYPQYAHMLPSAGQGRSMIDTLICTIRYSNDVSQESTSILQGQIAEADRNQQEYDELLALSKEAQEKAHKAADLYEEAQAQTSEAEEEYKNAKEQENEARNSTYSSASISLDEVNWGMDKTAFVDEWAPRIDAYLSGSPLSGYGKNFASAAYDYDVDPRWSPAISCIESGKGAVCFRSFNAWGYMGHSFSSWAEGIETHVKYLSCDYYHGRCTLEAARIYCPPTYTEWYRLVTQEMNKI